MTHCSRTCKMHCPGKHHRRSKRGHSRSARRSRSRRHSRTQRHRGGAMQSLSPADV